MFEQDELIQNQIESLYAATESLGRGDILTHETIRGILGCEPHTESWDHVVKQVRKRLQAERGIATWPENGVGYELLTVRKQLEFLPRKRLRKSARQVRWARASVDATPSDDMTPNQGAAALAISEALAAKERELRRGARSVASMYRATEPVVRVPLPDAFVTV